MRILLFLVALFTFTSSASLAQENETDSLAFKSENIITKKGKATYYHNKFVGRKTTSGQIYKHENYTAAHRTLPFGTEVTVLNPRNGKSVVVVINDRGPFSKSLMIDLSKSAAKELGIIPLGIATVEISYENPNAKSNTAAIGN